MKKLVVVLLGALALAGCKNDFSKEISHDFEMPRGLEGCKVYHLEGDDYRDLKVVRCPLSETTTQETYKSGKATKTAHTTITSY